MPDRRRTGVSASNIADAVLICSAIGVFILTWLDRAESRRGSAGLAISPAQEAPANWRNEIHTGIRWGSPDALLTIVEFMDFQCPYCARWALRVDSLIAEFPESVQLVTHHYPLSSHEFAVPAAVALECAHEQDASYRFQIELFRQQRLLGTKPWQAFAVEAGLQDVDRFGRCIMRSPDSFPRIAYGRELGSRVGVRGTPTVWINGAVERPNLERLREMVQQLVTETR